MSEPQKQNPADQTTSEQDTRLEDLQKTALTPEQEEKVRGGLTQSEVINHRR